MDDQTIKEVTDEMAPLLRGRAPGKIFQLSPLTMAIDFRAREGYLLLSADPQMPRLHLIKRRVRDLEKQSGPLNQFSLTVRKELAGTTLLTIRKDKGDRILRFQFSGKDELGKEKHRTLVAQLTGRSANLFLLDEAGTVRQSARPTKLPGQQAGETYEKPESSQLPEVKSDLQAVIRTNRLDSASEAVDAYFSTLLSQKAAADRAVNARSNLRRKLSQAQKLLKQLEADLQLHADAEQHKHLGDVLLANLSSAKRQGKRLTLIDYFAEGMPELEIELDEQVTLPEEASRRFALYSRSKRAIGQIMPRIAAVQSQISELIAKQELLETILGSADQAALEKFIAASTPAKAKTTGGKVERSRKLPGTRQYFSSDGFEILVGRTARDNDQLTFKVARPHDLWLHTADYAGSHVVVRNSTRKDLPPRTLIEAAQLAAYFSQAKKDPKVDVHYTQRKFLTKPKGAAPGLVRMMRFKSITVEPKEAGVRS